MKDMKCLALLEAEARHARIRWIMAQVWTMAREARR